MDVVLKWWFLACGSLVLIGLSTFLGWATKLWEVDQTKLSFVIIAVYFLATAFIGWMTTAYRGGTRRKWVAHYLDTLAEASDLCMRLAIMGTTLGFFLMISAAFAGAVTVQTVGEAAKGLSTIYLVTFVGVLCSSLLNLQLTNFHHLLEDVA